MALSREHAAPVNLSMPGSMYRPSSSRGGLVNRRRCRLRRSPISSICVLPRLLAAERRIRSMHIKRWRRLRDGAPAPWQADTNAYKQRFWCHDRPRSEKNGGFGYARGIFHEETMSVYR
eukprot:scaffold1948_cov62-Phaeocystis_antarctica.AAC.7